MFDDYKKAVISFYLEQKVSKKLSLNLESPTQAKLKKECLSILSERYHKKDDKTLLSFFDPTNKFNDHEKSILKFELDGFKAILKFLLGKSQIRKDENLELLAWLINFENRPYKSEHIYAPEIADPIVNKVEPNWDNWVVFPPVKPNQEHSGLMEETELILVEDSLLQKEDEGVNFDNAGSGDGSGYGSSEKVAENNTTTLQTVHPVQGKIKENIPPKRTFTWTSAKIKSAVIAFSLLVAASLGTYFSMPTETANIVNPILTGKEQCMYWTGENYRPILCNQKIENTPVIALDPQQLSGLKKITQPDTLTRNSINKVGYAKLGQKEIEFYTTTGNHPTIYNKRILPMTAYILNKYIVKK